jgi:leucyl aminopeptidase
VAAERVLLVGCGKRKEHTRTLYRQAVAAAVDLLQRTHAGEALCALPELAPEGTGTYLAVRDTVTTAADRVYRYAETKEDKKAPKTPLRVSPCGCPRSTI